MRSDLSLHRLLGSVEEEETREKQLKFCSICKNRQFDSRLGIVCNLTGSKANFVDVCINYAEDAKALRLEVAVEKSQKHLTKSKINSLQYSLFTLGGLFLLGGMKEFIIGDYDLSYGIVYLILAMIFIGLGFLSFRKASLSILLGITVVILLIGIGGSTFFLRGLTWKGLIFASLLYVVLTLRQEQSSQKKKGVDNLLDQI